MSGKLYFVIVRNNQEHDLTFDQFAALLRTTTDIELLAILDDVKQAEKLVNGEGLAF